MRSYRVRTVQHIPIENAVVEIVVILHYLREELTKEIIIRGLLEAELANVVQVDCELLCLDIRVEQDV